MKIGKMNSIDQKSITPAVETIETWNCHHITILAACGLAAIITSVALGSLSYNLVGDCKIGSVIGLILSPPTTFLVWQEYAHKPGCQQ